MSGNTKRNVAKYRRNGTNSDGDPVVYRKWIVVNHDESGDLTVTFAASQDENVDHSRVPECLEDYDDIEWNDSDDEEKKTFDWDRFLELVDAMKRGEYGRDGRAFVENVFVGGPGGPAAVSEQRLVTGKNPTVGGLETDPHRDRENGDFLRVYYQTENSDKPDLLTVRWVQSDDDGEFPDNVGLNAGDYYAWQVQDHELQQLLVENPNTDPDTEASEGFSREFREALFLNPRRHRVIDML